jgi:hypothetical protein
MYTIKLSDKMNAGVHLICYLKFVLNFTYAKDRSGAF